MTDISRIAAIVVLCGLIARSCSLAASSWDRYPDTWVATDALGRTVSTNERAGDPRPDKFVGIFYFLWLGQHGTGGPYDVTRILAAHPDAMTRPTSPPWGPLHAFHHWGEPLFGYYLSDDKWVLRKHAQMLADALIDVVVFDVTNQATYPKSYLALCETWTEVRKQGGATPQIAFLCPFGDPRKVVRQLYDDFYGKNLYPDLWFQWKGKPLILADPARVDADLKGFFTFRKPQPSYFQGPTGPDQWAWLEIYPQHVFPDSEGKPEQMTVGVGQNTQGTRCCAFSEANTYGRSTESGKKDARPGAVNLGLNFAQQWKRALEVDPEFIFITGWNEWVAMRLDEFGGVREPVMLVDEFTQEYSRDIEPMKGGHADNYYYQMVDYIRRFKGARKLPAPGPPKTIKIDGRFDDWETVSPEYRDEIGDTAHRDQPGWGDAGRYVDTTGRNDIVAAKVARDSKYVYFYIRTREPITPHTDPNWMFLLISTGLHRRTWEGYDFIVDRAVKGPASTPLEQCLGDWSWKTKCDLQYRTKGCEMELAIPRKALGLGGETKPLRFDFKWADGIGRPWDITEFTTTGDAAPNGRFAYRFAEKP